jgi:hypothetical protein
MERAFYNPRHGTGPSSTLTGYCVGLGTTTVFLETVSRRTNQIQHHLYASECCFPLLYLGYADHLQRASPPRTQTQQAACTYVLPNEESLATFATKGMSRRLGTEVKPSWAFSFCHISYIDRRLRESLKIATSLGFRHDLICAGLANLSGYLGWLRGTELFSIDRSNVTIVYPADGPLHELPPNVGAIMVNLLAETKTNACQVADVVMAYQTLSGLSLGFWFCELHQIRPDNSGPLFYTQMG